MTRAVVTVSPNSSVSDALRLMLGQRISGLPVVDDLHRVVGILTEGDLLRRVETGTQKARPGWLQFLRSPALQAADYARTHGRKIEEIMTREVTTAPETSTLEELVSLMENNHIRRVPITTDGRLVGVVSRADLLRVLARELDKTPPESSPDAVLRLKIVGELTGQPWVGRGQVTVVVTDGVAYLKGFVYDERERDAIRIAAETVAGIGKVHDELDCLDPNLGLMYGF
jgi:CBS domain-containing protein